MKRLFLTFAVGIGVAGALSAQNTAAGPEPAKAETEAAAAAEADDWKTLLHGIRYRELHEGDGQEPALWAAVYVHYRLRAEDGTVLEDTYSSESHGRRARKHVIGSGTMPEALELAVNSMRERGRREVAIPAELFSIEDFHTHESEDGHDDQEHNKLADALKPGAIIRGEISLLWVRPYEPSNFNRFQ